VCVCVVVGGAGEEYGCGVPSESRGKRWPSSRPLCILPPPSPSPKSRPATRTLRACSVISVCFFFLSRVSSFIQTRAAASVYILLAHRDVFTIGVVWSRCMQIGSCCLLAIRTRAGCANILSPSPPSPSCTPAANFSRTLHNPLQDVEGGRKLRIIIIIGFPRFVFTFRYFFGAVDRGGGFDF